jgi:hypothetical protein
MFSTTACAFTTSEFFRSSASEHRSRINVPILGQRAMDRLRIDYKPSYQLNGFESPRYIVPRPVVYSINTSAADGGSSKRIKDLVT